MHADVVLHLARPGNRASGSEMLPPWRCRREHFFLEYVVVPSEPAGTVPVLMKVMVLTRSVPIEYGFIFIYARHYLGTMLHHAVHE